MRRFGGPMVVAATLAFAASGCGDEGGSGDEAPATPAERVAVGQLQYCFEGAGALTAKPGARIAELDRTPSAPEAGDAKRVLVAYWANTGNAAHLYYASDAAAAERAAGDLGRDGVESRGNVIVVPDEDSPPSSDEALLASDCLP